MMMTWYCTGIGEYWGCFNTSLILSPCASFSLVSSSSSDPNCAKDASSLYWASSVRMGAAIFFIALIWAAPPTRDTESPALTAGLKPELNISVSRYICPSVMEITFVGIYAETSPACVSIMGSAVSEPPPYSSLMRAARSRSLEWR